MKGFRDNKTDICLVSPPTRASSITVPASLLYLHAWLTREKISGRIVDIKYGKLGVPLSKNQVQIVRQKIVNEISHVNPEFVGITCYSTEFWEVIELARSSGSRWERVMQHESKLNI